MSVEKCGWAVQKSLFAWTNHDSMFSHTSENSKIFNIASKYFSFFNNKPPVGWVAHIARDFLTCYSCLYYSSMHAAKIDRLVNEKNTAFLENRINLANYCCTFWPLKAHLSFRFLSVLWIFFESESGQCNSPYAPYTRIH